MKVKKNVDIICYVPTSLVYLQQGNVKKLKKSMKIVNIDEENLHIFGTNWISMKFLGRTWKIVKMVSNRAKSHILTFVFKKKQSNEIFIKKRTLVEASGIVLSTIPNVQEFFWREIITYYKLAYRFVISIKDVELAWYVHLNSSIFMLTNFITS